MKSPALRVAAGLIVVLGIIAVPVLLMGLEGWRKFAIVPVIYVSWKFANYSFRPGVPPKV
jgi:hypothetical protein